MPGIARLHLSRVTLAVLLLAAVGVLAARGTILTALGWSLVSDEPVDRADIIVVSIAASGAGALEAADLFHAGVAPRVAVFADPPDEMDQEFLRRGVPYEDEAARTTRQLKALGVPAVETIVGSWADGTEAEGRILPPWCDSHGFATVVVVAPRDHSRRLSRVLRRAMQGHSTRVAVRAARFSLFDPERWWKARGGTRIEIVELEKLLLDVVRHPFS